MRSWLNVALCGALLGAGCVSTQTYDAKVAELNKLRDDHDKAAADREKALQAKLAELNHKRDDLQKQLDSTTALAGELQKRLEALGQNVERLKGERGQLTQSLDEVKARFEELRRQKAAADAAAATFRDLVAKLRSMIDSGQLKVTVRDGRMLIALPNDVLFDSGRTTIKQDGKDALAKVAQVLATVDDRHFIVAGHTDNVPIHTRTFPSNWELSTARAVEVTKFLIANGMKPESLAAAGYGEFDPIAPNDSPEHSAQNRRIEIVLQPNIADLPSIDQTTTAGAAP